MILSLSPKYNAAARGIFLSLLLGVSGCSARPQAFGTLFQELCTHEEVLSELSLPKENELHSFQIIARSREGSFDFEAHIELSPQGITIVGMTPFGNRGILARSSLGEGNSAPTFEAEVHPLWPKWLSGESLLRVAQLTLLGRQDPSSTGGRVIERPGVRTVSCMGLVRYALAATPNSFVTISAPQGLSVTFLASGSKAREPQAR
jgi:hypothetical protein